MIKLTLNQKLLRKGKFLIFYAQEFEKEELMLTLFQISYIIIREFLVFIPKKRREKYGESNQRYY